MSELKGYPEKRKIYPKGKTLKRIEDLNFNLCHDLFTQKLLERTKVENIKNILEKFGNTYQDGYTSIGYATNNDEDSEIIAQAISDWVRRGEK